MSKDIDSSLESSGEKQVYASSWRRLIAYILDYILAFWISYVLYIISFIIIILAPFPLVTLYNNINNRVVELFDNNIIIFVLILYTVYFGLSFLIFGNTLGGKATGINVVNTAGGIISKGKLAFRGLIIGVLTSLSPLILLVSMTSLFDKKKRTLYDMVFGTVVNKELSHNNYDLLPQNQVYASALRRFSAYTLDIILLIVISVALSGGLLFAYLGGIIGSAGFDPFVGLAQNQFLTDIVTTNKYEGLYSLIYIFYFFFSFLLFGNTWGGHILKIESVNSGGERVSKIKLAFRALWSVLIPISAITVLFNDKKRAVHDIVFGTVVTKDRIL
jgi:uncharacterized RDD family membrane protein YckC